jgi:hypothetical protein
MESGLCLLVCPLGVVFVLFPEAMGPLTRDPVAAGASCAARRGVSQTTHEYKVAGSSDE